MIAYKGFTKELTATMGKGVYQFKAGEKAVTDKSKTASCGFHCCENPFECLGYYPLGKGNRYFMVEAEGNINEDDYERIACTELTLVKEMTLKEFAGHGMMYMVKHPARENWKQTRAHLTVSDADHYTEYIGDIAIVRSAYPKVKGVEGSYCGLIVEPAPGVITAAKLFTPGEDAKPDTWYTLDVKDRRLVEVQDEV